MRAPFKRSDRPRHDERPAPEPPPDPLVVAARVIGESSRQAPADQVLRRVLKETRGLTRPAASDVAHTVFAYYRWLGWLDTKTPTRSTLKAARELQQQFQQDSSSFSDAELLEQAVPAWARQQTGGDAAWVRAIQLEPVLWLRAQPGQGHELLMQLPDCQESAVPDAVQYSGEEDLFVRPEFHAGRFEIQDLSSQIVGHLCAPAPKETWWDTCAGQGGKMLHLSALMQNKGLIWATDRAEWRLTALKRRAARAKAFNYRTALWTDSSRPPTKTRFDGILVDAPCSGIGTWHRNPHARWTTTPEDVTELAAVQRTLLQTAAGSLKPGGRLVYAVCTMAREETEGVANWLTSSHPDLTPEKFAIEWLPKANGHSRVMLWPQDEGGSGMFVAQWRKQK